MTPVEIKLGLERKALELGVTIVGVHSILMADETTVSAIFDIEPDVNGGLGMNFTFTLPQMVKRDELSAFANWLASTGYAGETIH